jgi:hypothetical protein
MVPSTRPPSTSSILTGSRRLAEGERQPVAAGGGRGCGLEGGRLGREGDRGRRAVADQVLGPVAVVEDQELGIAGDHHAAEAAAAGVGDCLGAGPAGELLPEHRLADLGA